ncbi:hypothetical protein GCM10027517_01260 [Phycicoccus ginsengisoli]
MPTLSEDFFPPELELLPLLELVPPEPLPESPHAARASAATDTTAATFIV